MLSFFLKSGSREEHLTRRPTRKLRTQRPDHLEKAASPPQIEDSGACSGNKIKDILEAIPNATPQRTSRHSTWNPEATPSVSSDDEDMGFIPLSKLSLHTQNFLRETEVTVSTRKSSRHSTRSPETTPSVSSNDEDLGFIPLSKLSLHTQNFLRETEITVTRRKSQVYPQMTPNFDDDEEEAPVLTPQTSLARTEEVSSTTNRPSASFSEPTSSISNGTMNSVFSYFSSQTLITELPETSPNEGTKQFAVQRRRFTINELIFLENHCKKREDCRERSGKQWKELAWSWHLARSDFRREFGWTPDVDRMEDFELRREEDKDFWLFWDFPTNLV